MPQCLRPSPVGRLAVLAFWSTVPTTPSGVGQEAPEAPTRRALLVGVGDYANAEISDLPGPYHDVRAVRDLLMHSIQLSRRGRPGPG